MSSWSIGRLISVCLTRPGPAAKKQTHCRYRIPWGASAGRRAAAPMVMTHAAAFQPARAESSNDVHQMGLRLWTKTSTMSKVCLPFQRLSVHHALGPHRSTKQALERQSPPPLLIAPRFSHFPSTPWNEITAPLKGQNTCDHRGCALSILCASAAS